MKHSPWLVVFSTCNTDLSHLRHPVVLLHRPLGCQVHLADENGLWLSSKMLCVCVFSVASSLVLSIFIRCRQSMDMRWVSAVRFSPAEPRSARLDFFFLHTERLKCFMTAESQPRRTVAGCEGKSPSGKRGMCFLVPVVLGWKWTRTVDFLSACC